MFAHCLPQTTYSFHHVCSSRSARSESQKCISQGRLRLDLYKTLWTSLVLSSNPYLLNLREWFVYVVRKHRISASEFAVLPHPTSKSLPCFSLSLWLCIWLESAIFSIQSVLTLHLSVSQTVVCSKSGLLLKQVLPHRFLPVHEDNIEIWLTDFT